MLTLLTIVHFLVSIFLIVIVLLQHGKGADMGAAFGGSGKTVFGTEGPLPLMNKITTASAILFMFTSVTLAYYSANTTRSSVMKSLPITQSQEKKVEVAPVPLEVPMTDTNPTPVGEKGTAPAEFPGAKAAPVAEPPMPAAEEAEQQPTAVETAPSEAAPATTEAAPATEPEQQKEETVPAPTTGQ